MANRPRTVFLGTPAFAVPSLEALARTTEVVLVITQPDRPAGRGRKVEPPPVKSCALDLGLEVIQPDVVKGRRFAQTIAKLAPDFLVTAAFGRLLGPSLLKVPSRAPLNLHASLLPRHRGAAPVAWAILSGDAVTGVSIMRMEEGLDTGPVYLRAQTPIAPEETAAELSARLALLGAETLVEAIARFDSLVPEPQDPEEATWASLLKKSDGIVDWSKSAADLHNHVRAMNPWPCAFTSFDGEPLKIHAAQVLGTTEQGAFPGLVLAVGHAGIDVACGRGALRLTEIQAPGKKRLEAARFLAGSAIAAGSVLGG